MPKVITQPVVKAKTGDLREMVLPGGGDVTTRIWASMRVKLNALNKWQKAGAYNTDAGKDAIKKLTSFINVEGQLFEHAWKDIEVKEALRIRVETSVLLDSFEDKKPCEAKDLIRAVDQITNSALEKGKLKAKEAYEENIAQALRNGAGPAHKITAVDSALPPLRLVVEEETKEGKNFITAPIKVAEKHTEPWAKTWCADDPSYQKKVVK